MFKKTSVFNKLLLTGLFSAYLTACGGSGGSDGSSGNQTSSKASSSSVASSPASSSSSSASADDGPIASLHTLADFPVGVSVSAGTEPQSLLANTANGEAQRNVVETHFSQLTAGNIMKMSYLYKDNGNSSEYDFTLADALVDYGNEEGLSMHGHVLVWHSDYQVPNWMKNYTGDWEAMLTKHTKDIVDHFEGRVVSWDVVNEAFHDTGEYRNENSNAGEGSLFYRKLGKSYIETAFEAARSADPEVDLYYNDFNISNNGPKFKAVLAMVDDFQARDIPIDGVGFQMHVFMDWPSATDIKNNFQQIVDRGLKVKITELDIPINNPYDGSYNYPNNYQATLTPVLANAQKKRYCDIVSAYMDVVPEDLRGGITVWGINDSSSWLIQQLFDNKHQDWPLLFDNSFHQKPALEGVADGLTGKACL